MIRAGLPTVPGGGEAENIIGWNRSEGAPSDSSVLVEDVPCRSRSLVVLLSWAVSHPRETAAAAEVLLVPPTRDVP